MSLTVQYLKGKKFEITCRSHQIITDQPNSEGGTDQGMTPIELLIASLTSCAAFYTVTFLERRIPTLAGLEVRSTWEYSENPHRVGTIHLTIVLPKRLRKHEKKGLLRTVEQCTIENTLKHSPTIHLALLEE
jgi:putative redox protein